MVLPRLTIHNLSFWYFGSHIVLILSQQLNSRKKLIQLYSK